MGKPQTITARKLDRIAREDETQPLSPTEYEVVRRFAAGQMWAEVMADMGIARGTVHKHRTNAYQKLGVPTMIELWRALGWLRVPSQQPTQDTAQLDWRDSR